MLTFLAAGTGGDPGYNHGRYKGTCGFAGEIESVPFILLRSQANGDPGTETESAGPVGA